MTITTGRAHLYCRVSSAGQEDGYSLDTQEAAGRRWCEQRSLTVASVAHEVKSGGDRVRPALDRIIDALAPGDVVLAYALDRFSRDQVHTVVFIDRIERAGATLQLVTEDFEESATGKFLRNAKSFAAELELEKIKERTGRGKRARVASGKPLAGPTPPFGYLWGDAEKSRLIHDPETAEVAGHDLALSGMPLRRMSAELAARGIPAPSGAPHWWASSLRQVLTRPTYAGMVMAYAASEEPVALPGIAEPIVTAAEFAAAGARLASNKAESTRRNAHPERSLLRCGHIVCGHCGGALTVANATPANPRYSAKYRCTAPRQHDPACPRPSIATSVIDGEVWERVADVLRDPEIVAREVARRRDDGSLDRDLAALDRRIAALSDKPSRMARRVGDIDDDEVAAPLLVALKAMSSEKGAAQRERDDLAQRRADRAEEDRALRSLADWCSRVGAKLSQMSYDKKRLALHALGVTVRAFRKGSVDAGGNPNPRWEMTMAVSPVSPTSATVYTSTCG